MDPFLIGLCIVTIIGYLVVFLSQPDLAFYSIKSSVQLFVQSLPWILVSILLAGLLEQYLQKKLIYVQIGKPKLWWEIALGTILGTFGTGSRWAAYPLAALLLKTGFSPAGVISFLSSWFLISLPRLSAEIPFLGMRFVGMRLVISIGVSILAGFLAKWIWF